MSMNQSRSPLVSVVMGSDSDWEVMKGAADTLAEFAVPAEARVVSAHRTPEDMVAFAQQAAERGVRVVIAGAGGAAHLPGMIASLTHLPVIGVPVAATRLVGMDALLSIVQMPRGVPVATVAVNGAHNAALLALRMLAIADSDVASKLVAHRARLADEARAADARLAER